MDDFQSTNSLPKLESDCESDSVSDDEDLIMHVRQPVLKSKALTTKKSALNSKGGMLKIAYF